MQEAARLRERGLRATAQRQAVLSVLGQRPHATAEVLFDDVRARLGAVSRQAVYDCLAALESVGLVRRFGPPGQAARFEVRTAGTHQHLICRECGDVQDVHVEAPAPPPGDHGYEVASAEVVYWGRCPACLSIGSAQHREEDHVG